MIWKKRNSQANDVWNHSEKSTRQIHQEDSNLGPSQGYFKRI